MPFITILLFFAPFLTFILACSLFLYYIYSLSIGERNRIKSISDYCFKNDLKYSEFVHEIPKLATTFSLLAKKGHTNEWKYGMSGMRANYEFHIFEHRSVFGYGKNRHVETTTNCIVLNKDIDIPSFFIRDENFILDSLGKVFGGQDINFSDDQQFSRMFVLQGASEGEIRKSFIRKVRESFVKNHIKGYSYEGNLNCFMVSVSGKLNLQNRIALLNKAINIFNSFNQIKNQEFLN